jgi:hypothetical protein
MVEENTIITIDETIGVMDLKQAIIDKINRIDDVEKLKMLQVFADYLSIPTVDPNNITKEQWQLIDQDVTTEERETISDEDLNREINRWLNEE